MKKKRMEDIENQLAKLPLLQDTKSKASYIKKLKTSKMEKKQSKLRYLPYFSAAAVFMLLILILPSFFIQDSESDNTQSLQTADQFVSLEDKAPELTDNPLLLSGNTNEKAVYAAVLDPKMQYLIPYTFIEKGTAGKESLVSDLNQLPSHLNEIGVLDDYYFFSDASFFSEGDQLQVTIKNRETFSRRKTELLGPVLALMMDEYNYSDVTISSSADENEANETISLKDNSQFLYKLYKQRDEEVRLIAIPIHEETFTEALEEMKITEPQFEVIQSIPENLSVTAHTAENQDMVRITFNELPADTETQSEMSAAILMTAKSFGFQYVQFESDQSETNSVISLGKKVPVPRGANPINVSE